LGNIISILRCLDELWNAMFNCRDFLRVEYNVLSKNVTRDVSQSEKNIIWSHIIKLMVSVCYKGYTWLSNYNEILENIILYWKLKKKPVSICYLQICIAYRNNWSKREPNRQNVSFFRSIKSHWHVILFTLLYDKN
jgi:hypothetical protein